MGLIVPDYVATWPSLAVKAIGRHFKNLFITGTQTDIQSSSDEKQTSSSPPPTAKRWMPSENEPLHPVILDLTHEHKTRPHSGFLHEEINHKTPPRTRNVDP